jgi:hypothetical protein
VRRPAEDRFWAKVEKTEGCWLWTGSRRPPGGYGQFRSANQQMVSTHRFSWELHNGLIPPGLCVCHRCDNPACVRPDHLFLGTMLDNNRDMMAKGRDRYAGRTHCDRGHELTAENVCQHRGRNGKPWRECKTCKRLYEQHRVQRQREMSVAAGAA